MIIHLKIIHLLMADVTELFTIKLESINQYIAKFIRNIAFWPFLLSQNLHNSYWNRLRLKNLGKLARLACHRIDQFTLESFFKTLRDIKFCRLPLRGCERNIRRDCNEWHFAMKWENMAFLIRIVWIYRWWWYIW